MSGRDERMQDPFSKRFFASLFNGYDRTLREDRVREYIVHRLNEGACFKEVLEEGYVRRNCTKEEVDEIIRDPRLIHEDREGLKRFFESGELDPLPARSRR
jgi:hypothetical protein